FDLLVLVEQRRIEIGILMDADGTVAAVARGDEAQPASLVAVGEGLLLVARRQPFLVWQQPDLQEVHRLIGRVVVLAMPDPRARRHALHVARADHRAGADAVPGLDAALQAVGHDFHIRMAMSGERAAWPQAIFVDHAQGAEAHMLRVVIVAEGKAVPAVEPAEVGDAALRGGADGDHGGGDSYTGSKSPASKDV